MSKVTGDSLYERLPGWYREEDTRAGGVARAVLDVIAAEVDRVAAQIDELHDSWFIETCPDWAVPYVADLLGVSLTHDLLIGGELASVVSQRARVANTIRYRRRKGTASVLESLAFDATGWRTAAVEEFERLLTTQHLAHPRVHLPNTVDLRRGANLEATPGAFAQHAHTVDIHDVRLAQPDVRPHQNTPNVSLHSFRIDGLLVPLATAQAGPAAGQYVIDLLGRDRPLVNPPLHDAGIDVRTGEDEVPALLRRRRLREELDARRQAAASGEADPAPRWLVRPPFQLFLVVNPGDAPVAITPDKVDVCCLDPWKPAAANGRARVDPIAGRVVLPDPQPHRLLVTAAPGGIPGVGAGPALRPDTRDQWGASAVTWQRGVSRDLAPVAGQLTASLAAAIAEWAAQPPGTVGLIVLMDNDRHDVSLTGANRITVPEGSRLGIVAADWPLLPVIGGVPGQTARRLGVIEPTMRCPALVGDIEVRGLAPTDSADPGEFTLDGVLLAGALTVTGSATEQLGRITVAHCTQVTGGVDAQGPRPLLAVTVAASQVGPVSLSPSVSDLSIGDSVVDGAGGTAIAAPGALAALEAVTTFGPVASKQLEASGCMFTAPVTVTMHQQGCVRYSYLPSASTTPRRYRCIDDPTPTFVSRRRGSRSYAVLDGVAGDALRTAGEHGDELGAYQLVRATHREQNAAIALSEYQRVGIAAGVIREF